MKIGSTQGVGGTAGVSGPARKTRAGAAASSSRARSIQDVASIMNIPPAEMTEPVRAAIMALLDEVSSLGQALDSAKARLAEMERLVDEDPLIPIHNRRAFVREMSRLNSFARRYGTPSSLVYIDLNDIKKVNDEHGHAAGDAVLLHVARLLSSNVRDIDIVGRLGGDEFGVLLVRADEQQSEMRARALADTIAETPLVWKGQRIPLSLAYGVTTFTDTEDPLTALADADQIMYENKRRAKAGA